MYERLRHQFYFKEILVVYKGLIVQSFGWVGGNSAMLAATAATVGGRDSEVPSPGPAEESPRETYLVQATAKEKVKQGLKKYVRIFRAPVILTVLLMLYSFVGAAIFEAIESPNEKETKNVIMKKTSTLISTLYNITQ